MSICEQNLLYQTEKGFWRWDSAAWSFNISPSGYEATYTSCFKQPRSICSAVKSPLQFPLTENEMFERKLLLHRQAKLAAAWIKSSRRSDAPCMTKNSLPRNWTELWETFQMVQMCYFSPVSVEDKDLHCKLKWKENGIFWVHAHNISKNRCTIKCLCWDLCAKTPDFVPCYYALKWSHAHLENEGGVNQGSLTGKRCWAGVPVHLP